MVLVKNEERQNKKMLTKNIVLLDKIDWAKKINDKKNNLM